MPRILSGDCRYDVNHRYSRWRLICLPDKPFRRHSESEPRWLSARLMIHPDVAQILGHIHDAGNHLGNLPPPGDSRQASRFDGCVKCATLREELACSIKCWTSDASERSVAPQGFGNQLGKLPTHHPRPAMACLYFPSTVCEKRGISCNDVSPETTDTSGPRDPWAPPGQSG